MILMKKADFEGDFGEKLRKKKNENPKKKE